MTTARLETSNDPPEAAEKRQLPASGSRRYRPGMYGGQHARRGCLPRCMPRCPRLGVGAEGDLDKRLAKA